MSIDPGTYELGPASGELLVHTGRGGAAAKAGHDLTIEVTSWSATLTVPEDAARSEARLIADGGSLKVREGRGGIQSLGEDDKAGISQTIDDEVLRRSTIEFRSTAAQATAEGLKLTGELSLVGSSGPVSFELAIRDGRLTAAATIAQSDFGIKPYSTLFGTLKVANEVRVTIDAALSPQSR